MGNITVYGPPFDSGFGEFAFDSFIWTDTNINNQIWICCTVYLCTEDEPGRNCSESLYVSCSVFFSSCYRVDLFTLVGWFNIRITTIAVGDLMFLGMQDFDFTQIFITFPKFRPILPPQKIPMGCGSILFNLHPQLLQHIRISISR